MKKIALFASGNGSNVENIYNYFKNNLDIQIELVLCNKPKAGVIDLCLKHNIKYMTFDKKDLYENGNVSYMLDFYRIDFIVLAGFLWLIPKSIIDKYQRRIINVHPALLPNHGGKGMYGMKVHESVIASGDVETGITIHYVNEKYDEGDMICRVGFTFLNETPESIAYKVHKLEYEHYPKTIEKLVMDI